MVGLTLTCPRLRGAHRSRWRHVGGAGLEQLQTEYRDSDQGTEQCERPQPAKTQRRERAGRSAPRHGPHAKAFGSSPRNLWRCVAEIGGNVTVARASPDLLALTERTTGAVDVCGLA